MGPVYVYENEYTAGRGVAVDLAELYSLHNEFDEPIIQQRADPQRAVRQLFVDDVNQLPVTPRMPYNDEGGIDLYAPTLSTCFRRKGVTAMIAEKRQSWRRVAERYKSLTWVEGRYTDFAQSTVVELKADERQSSTSDAEEEEKGSEVEDGEESEDEDAEEEDEEGDWDEETEEEEEEEDGSEDGGSEYGEYPYTIAMDDRDGAKLDYVDPLMDALLKSLHNTMWEEESWTAEVARMASVDSSVAAGLKWFAAASWCLSRNSP
jgi:hypothetical protein